MLRGAVVMGMCRRAAWSMELVTFSSSCWRLGILGRTLAHRRRRVVVKAGQSARSRIHLGVWGGGGGRGFSSMIVSIAQWSLARWGCVWQWLLMAMSGLAMVRSRVAPASWVGSGRLIIMRSGLLSR